jgi:hypothetical protein
MYQNRHFRHHDGVPEPSPDPLVVDIARRLQNDGAFVLHLDTGEFGTGHIQTVVDIGWAARQAGQLLDRAVRVTTTETDEPSQIVVTAEFADAG